MREQIGDLAGKVWSTLGQNGEVNIATLPKLLGEKGDAVYQALGWLAHEGKINYSRKSNKNFVSLNDFEREVFKTVH